MTQEKRQCKNVVAIGFHYFAGKAMQYIADMEKHPEKVAALHL